MTSQARAKQTLLPLLLFTLIVPALQASVKATSLAILGDPMEQGRAWGSRAHRIQRDLLVVVRTSLSIVEDQDSAVTELVTISHFFA
jgi:ABC-type transport system involved in cytochrome c biogenesis permease component